MTLNAPQIIFCILMITRLTAHGIKHGEKLPYTEYNFWHQFIATIITSAFLYWGGFFA